MNEIGRELANELSSREYGNLEYRKKLIRIQNMSMLCHRSAEIDQGTLLYFSVNDMFLGDRDFFVLLFSENSPPQKSSQTGRDVYGQLFTYAIIEEVVKECFSGHYTFYSSELDGRLVVIVCFLYGLLPNESDIHFLHPTCEEVSRICEQRYDMKVITYVSDVVKNVTKASVTYHKLLNLATLHRYIEREFERPVYQMDAPPMEDYSVIPPLPFRESARELSNAIIERREHLPIARDMMNSIATFHANSTEDLKVRLGDYFDIVCSELKIRGIKLRAENLREEQFRVLSESRHWRECTDWLYRTLDKIAREKRSVHQQTLLMKLERAQAYITDNLQNPNLSVAEIGSAVDMNPSFISTAFKRQLNMTPTEFIRKQRLEKSLKLLKDRKLTVEQVSGECGFGSVETFHRVFKNEFGTSPARLRRELNN